MAKDQKNKKEKAAKKQELLHKLDRLESLHSVLDNLLIGQEKSINIDQIKKEIGILQFDLSDNSPRLSDVNSDVDSLTPSSETSSLQTASTEDTEKILDDSSEVNSDVNLEAIIADIDSKIRPYSGDELDGEVKGKDSEEDKKRHVLFALAGSQYAISAAHVQEVGEVQRITPVPNVPEWLAGVVNLRGDIISMVDLRVFLGLEPMMYQQSSRMLVTQAGPENMIIGLIVDQVSSIKYLATDRITAPTAPIENQITSYLKGVYEHEGQLLIVLDIEQMLLSSEMQQFQAA